MIWQAMSNAAFPLVGSIDKFADPLTVAHRRELSAARDRAKSIRKAARVAAFNGWSSAAIAALSAPFSLFSSVGLVLTVGIAFVAFNEFRGRKRLLNFDPSGARLLGWNQLALLAMIVGYCAWMMRVGIGDLGAGALSSELKGLAELDSGLASMVDSYQPMIQQAVRGFYFVVIALSVIFQGGTALYYFTRRRLVEDFVAETPEWVRDVQRGTLPA
jgi:hypothetical protein